MEQSLIVGGDKDLPPGGSTHGGVYLMEPAVMPVSLSGAGRQVGSGQVADGAPFAVRHSPLAMGQG